MVLRAPFIFKAHVDSVTAADDGEHVTLSQVEILKIRTPHLPAYDPVTIHFRSYGDRVHPWPSPGSEVLVFTDNYSDSGQLLLYDFIVLDALSPAHTGSGDALRDLTLQTITDPEKILAIVREEARRAPPAYELADFWFPYAAMWFPKDGRLLPHARNWISSNDPRVRGLAIQVFMQHPDPQDTPSIRALLNDPYQFDAAYRLSPWSRHEFLIRRLATLALEQRGEAFQRPELSTPWDDLYQPLPWAKVAVVMGLPPVVFLFIRRKWHQRRGFPPTTLPKTFLACATFISIYSSACLTGLWYRASSVSDEVVWASRGFFLSIDSVGQNLAVETTTSWPWEMPPVYLSVLSDHSDFQNAESALNQIDGGEWASARWLLVAQPARIEPAVPPFTLRPLGYSGYMVIVAYPYLILLLLSFPVARFSLPALWRRYHALRLRRSARAGLCSACSYDLRAHPVGARCPECGTLIARPLASHIVG
jgi:hypothetical protein